MKKLLLLLVMGLLIFTACEISKDLEPSEEEYLVNPDEIRSGGPPKGGIGVDLGIPALAEDDIKFISVEEASEWIDDEQLILVLSYEGIDRVYPMQILVFHEIVNDRIKDKPVTITFCPLCGSGIAYEGTVDVNGERIETRFGTSGKLYNSNLIMYDELTDTYWTQIDGLAIHGELIGQELNKIDLDTVKFGEWKTSHPDAQVLSKDTGFSRPYGEDDGPYTGYYESDYLIFNPVKSDNRLHAKDVVFGIEIDDKFKAYREEDLEGTIKDTFNGVDLEVTKNSDGTVDIKRLDIDEIIPKERDFWFAWYAFHSDTELY